MEGWYQSLSSVAATGNLKQLYPDFAPVGANLAVATTGQQIRRPTEGKLWQLQIETDNTNDGYIELWDINGLDAGADVSSATAITNAQLVAAQALGKAKLIWKQNFIASPETPVQIGARAFQFGLAARFVGTGGVCGLNMTVSGGYRLNDKI